MVPTPTNPLLSSTAQVTNTQGTSFSDHVALAALILSGGAFVIAFLQMIIAYLTSTLRDKCSTGAIGGWQKSVDTSWDFRHWRIHVLYPEVDLNFERVLKARKGAQLAKVSIKVKPDDIRSLESRFGPWSNLGYHECN